LQLFLEDAKIKNFTSCYKEQKFLDFFFNNLRLNHTDRYKNEYLFVSNCGRERNYLKCNDLPFVITQLNEETDMLEINGLKSNYWTLKFDPVNVFYNSSNGRLYYFFEDKHLYFNNDDLILKRKLERFHKIPWKICLIKSKLSIKLMGKLKENIDEKGESKFLYEYKNKTFCLELIDKELYRQQLDTYSSYKYNENYQD
jgi:hypothetical protein